VFIFVIPSIGFGFHTGNTVLQSFLTKGKILKEVPTILSGKERNDKLFMA
jgi:hypothetical protein